MWKELIWQLYRDILDQTTKTIFQDNLDHIMKQLKP